MAHTMTLLTRVRVQYGGLLTLQESPRRRLKGSDRAIKGSAGEGISCSSVRLPTWPLPSSSVA
eukprot:scaffold76111_cov63-Phaeocystis_antarctica.AAC.3